MKKIKLYRAVVILDKPVETESLYVSKLRKKLYRIESIPFFAYNISLGDIVECSSDDEGLGLFVGKTIIRYGNRTIRIRFGGEEEIRHPEAKILLKYLSDNKLAYEIFDPRIFSINIPRTFSWQAIEQRIREIVENVSGSNWEIADPNPECDVAGREITHQ